MATENYIDGQKGHGQIVLMLRLILAFAAHIGIRVFSLVAHYFALRGSETL